MNSETRRRRPPPILETERLLLRRPKIEDAETIHELYVQDEEVCRYTTWLPTQSLEETKAFIQRCVDNWKGEKQFEYIIELRDSEQVIGMFGLEDRVGKAEMGYVLAKPYWSNGYMTEVVKAILSWGLGNRHYQRMHAVCDVDNLASARVMEKSGMTFEGVLRSWMKHPQQHPSKMRDCRMYSKVS